MQEIIDLFKEKAKKNKINVIETSSLADLKEKLSDFLNEQNIKSVCILDNFKETGVINILKNEDIDIVKAEESTKQKVDLGVFESDIGIAENGKLGFINYCDIKQYKNLASSLNIAFLKSSNLVENVEQAEKVLKKRIKDDKSFIISFSGDKESSTRHENSIFNSQYVFLL